MDKEQFGKFVARIRKEKKMTQQQLAEKLYVTDKAVSKWERGLSYPDLTLLEPLAQSLDLTVNQLLACQKDVTTTLDQPMRTMLEVAGENQKMQKRKMWCLVVCGWFAAVFLLVGAFFAFFTNITIESCASFVAKEKSGENYYLYLESDGRLLTLECKDQSVYDSVTIQNGKFYDVTYDYNRFNYRGQLKTCAEAGYVLGGTESLQGAVIAIDSLLGIPCVLKEYVQAYTADGENLYALKFYYVGDGKDYYEVQEYEEYILLEVDACQNTVAYDYDEDGVVELFVLTKYIQKPYLLYELENGEIISGFIENVPQIIKEELHRVG